MNIRTNRHSVLTRAITMASLCLFFVNSIVWAYPDEAPQKSTLAVPSQLSKEEFMKRFMARASVLMHPAANEALHTLIMADKGSFENWEKDRTAELDVDDMSMRGKIKTRIEGFSKVKIVKVTGLFNKTGQFAHVGLSGKGKDFDYGMPVIYIDALYYDKANTAALRHELDEIIQWEELRSILANAYGMDRGQFGMREWIKAHIKDSDEKLSGTKYQGLNSLQISERIHKASYSLKGLYNLVNAGNKKFFEHIDYDYIRELYNRYLDEEGKDVNIAAKTGPIQGTRKTKVERLLDDGRTLIDKGRFKDANRLLARLSFFVEHAEWRDEWGHEIHIDLGGRVIEDGGYSNKYDGDGYFAVKEELKELLHQAREHLTEPSGNIAINIADPDTAPKFARPFIKENDMEALALAIVNIEDIPRAETTLYIDKIIVCLTEKQQNVLQEHLIQFDTSREAHKRIIARICLEELKITALLRGIVRQELDFDYAFHSTPAENGVLILDYGLLAPVLYPTLHIDYGLVGMCDEEDMLRQGRKNKDPNISVSFKIPRGLEFLIAGDVWTMETACYHLTDNTIVPRFPEALIEEWLAIRGADPQAMQAYKEWVSSKGVAKGGALNNMGQVIKGFGEGAGRGYIQKAIEENQLGCIPSLFIDVNTTLLGKRAFRSNEATDFENRLGIIRQRQLLFNRYLGREMFESSVIWKGTSEKWPEQETIKVKKIGLKTKDYPYLHTPGEKLASLSSSDFTIEKDLGGSTGAILVCDNRDNRKKVVKFSLNEQHVANEALANCLYREAGVNVPETESALIDGRRAILTAFVEGKRIDSEAMSNDSEITGNFAVDAWLANWDVVANEENVISAKSGGKTFRVDNGGAMEFRARGKPKGRDFGNKVGEIRSMREMSPVFYKLTDKEVARQVLLLSKRMTPDKIDQAFCQSAYPVTKREPLKAKLLVRLSNMRKWAENIVKHDETARSSTKGSPAEFLETMRDNLMQQALSVTGFAFKDIAPLRKHGDRITMYQPGTVYKEIRILISLGILERIKVDGKTKYRLSSSIRALDAKHAALVIDTINNIEYRIGRTANPLQRYEIPEERDRQFVKGLVQKEIAKCVIFGQEEKRTSSSGMPNPTRYSAEKDIHAIREYINSIGRKHGKFERRPFGSIVGISKIEPVPHTWRAYALGLVYSDGTNGAFIASVNSFSPDDKYYIILRRDYHDNKRQIEVDSKHIRNVLKDTDFFRKTVKAMEKAYHTSIDEVSDSEIQQIADKCSMSYLDGGSYWKVYLITLKIGALDVPVVIRLLNMECGDDYPQEALARWINPIFTTKDGKEFADKLAAQGIFAYYGAYKPLIPEQKWPPHGITIVGEFLAAVSQAWIEGIPLSTLSELLKPSPAEDKSWCYPGEMELMKRSESAGLRAYLELYFNGRRRIGDCNPSNVMISKKGNDYLGTIVDIDRMYEPHWKLSDIVFRFIDRYPGSGGGYGYDYNPHYVLEVVSELIDKYRTTSWLPGLLELEEEERWRTLLDEPETVKSWEMDKEVDLEKLRTTRDEIIRRMTMIASAKPPETIPAIKARNEPKGSPAQLLETVRDELLKEAMSENGFVFKDVAALRGYTSRTVYKEIQILISLGIFERVKTKGAFRLRFTASIRVLDAKHAALVIDTINNIEYRIGRTTNPLQRYEIPEERDRQFVKELVRNAVDIEKTQYLPDILPPATAENGRYYTIRYNEKKLSSLGLDAALSRSIFKAYATLLRARLGGAERLVLRTNNSARQPLVSVECYNDAGRTGAPIGRGHVNIAPGAFREESILRIINMADMAFAVSNIPLEPKRGEIDQYARLISFIQSQYRELTGRDISLEEILRDDRIITLPAMRPLPFERLKEYYEFTIRQLEQAA